MAKHQIYTMGAAKVYGCYISKAEKKGVQNQKSMKLSVGCQGIARKS